MKPLKDYAPFTIGERFEDKYGDVLEIVSSDRFAWVVVDGIECNRGPWPITDDDAVKPLDRTSEALDELAQLDADEVCGQKPWRDMTDEEKAPILLAWADGKSIEWWDDDIGSWCAIVNDPQGWDVLAYRIAPEDVRGSVVLHGSGYDSVYEFSEGIAGKYDTHKITFDTINGEPVLDSIKMERLK